MTTKTEREPRVLTVAEREAVARLLFNSWLDIAFDYDHLTDREKHAVDRETFRTLSIFARDPYAQIMPAAPKDWLRR